LNSEIYDKILTASYKLFGEYGYEKTSMNMIYKEAGVSKGSIYYHFENKEQLFLATVKHCFEQMDMKEFDFKVLNPENYESMVLNIGLSHIDMMKEDPGFAGIMKEAIFYFKDNMNESEILKSVLNDYISFYETLFEYGKSIGVVKEEVDSLTASRSLAIFLDAISMYSLIESGVDLGFSLKQLYEYVLKSIVFK